MADRPQTEFLEELLALPDHEAQTKFIQLHAADLDDEVALALKSQVDRLMRADTRRAQDVTRLMGEVAARTKAPKHRALSLLAEANLYCIGLARYEDSIRLYDEAADIYNKLELPVESARCQVGKIGALANLGRFDQALETGEWASEVLSEGQALQPYADLTLNLAAIYHHLGRDRQALEHLDRASDTYEILGPEGRTGVAWALQNKTVILRNLGRFDESIAASAAAHDLLAELGQPIEAARSKQNRAMTYYVIGDYNEALRLLFDVGETFEADGRTRDAALVEVFITECLLKLRRYESVIERSSRAERIFESLATPNLHAQAIIDQTEAYVGLGRFSEALARLEEAEELLAGSQVHAIRELARVTRADVLCEMGEFSHALDLARSAATRLDEADLPTESSRAALIAGRAALGLDDVKAAREIAALGLAESERLGVPLLIYQFRHLLSKVHALEQDFEQALELAEMAIAELERVRGGLMIEHRISFVQRQSALYEDAVALALALEDADGALRLAERSKSRALQDVLTHRLSVGLEAKDAADQPLVEELLELRRRRDSAHRVWETSESRRQDEWLVTRSDQGQIGEEVRELENRMTELWHELLVRSADYARDASLWTVHTEPAQPYLDDETALIEYFVIHDELLAFVVTRSDTVAHRLDTRMSTIAELLQLLWLNFETMPMLANRQAFSVLVNAQQLLREMHRQLIEPIAAELSRFKRAIVVPHGVLHYVPFHALHDGDEYFVETIEIGHLPASSLLRFSSQPAKHGGGALAIGYSGEGQLPHAVLEAESVAKILEGDVLLESRASRDEVLAQGLWRKTIHFATHGEFRSDNPLFTGLLLKDSWLTTFDVFNWKLEASLVTLSACQTGRSIVGGGDELMGLSRAFLHAGADSLLVTLWAVEDESTEFAMRAFYQELNRGRSKSEALRRAQLTMLHDSENGKWQHPYYWAPFVLIGHMGPLDDPRPNERSRN